MKTFAVVFTYSFDLDAAVYLFNTQEKAIKFMIEQYNEELRIDREENEWDTEAYMSEDKMYAKIINYFGGREDVTEFYVTQVCNV